jgi:hypothetical protein
MLLMNQGVARILSMYCPAQAVRDAWTAQQSSHPLVRACTFLHPQQHDSKLAGVRGVRK